MYSNHSDAIQEAVCFFMDEERGHKICYVQYPQCFHNISTNDIYSNVANAVHEVSIQNTLAFGFFVWIASQFFSQIIVNYWSQILLDWTLTFGIFDNILFYVDHTD